jgi:hypothetical protein
MNAYSLLRQRLFNAARVPPYIRLFPISFLLCSNYRFIGRNLTPRDYVESIHKLRTMEF